ncbi:MAG: hypothetical protein AAF283_11180 [Cyanobacteria bacterium P01_A01_bin.70]
MSLFKQRTAANPEKLRQLKAWVHEALALPEDVPISISQLQCHEPGCPPIETVVAVMSQPPQTFKIHAGVEAIAQGDVERMVKPSGG